MVVKILTTLRRSGGRTLLMGATLEMDYLEEYVGINFKYKSLPPKNLTISLDKADAAAIAACVVNKYVQKKESMMKKAKAHDLVRATKEYPKRLVMNADMLPYKAYAQLKAKYSVAKNRQDFTTFFDAQWNKFKVLDISVDPDKIFATSIWRN